MTYTSPIIKMAAIAYVFNGKVAVEINGVKSELTPEDALKLANGLYDAKHRIDLENTP